MYAVLRPSRQLFSLVSVRRSGALQPFVMGWVLNGETSLGEAAPVIASLQMRSIIALLAVLSSALFGQTRAGEPIKTSLCELARDPERFNNKLVEIRGEFVSRFEWEGFVDETCSARIQVGANHVLDGQVGQYAFASLDDLTHPERLNWQPIEPRLRVDLKRDDNYRAFRKYSGTKFKWPDGGRCQDCPLYRIIVAADGRFDYFASQNVALRTNPKEKAVGISAGDLPLLRFVLQSVSDVSATPIDPSLYSEKKGRDVTREEAHELVTAALRHHGGYALDEYEVESFPDFQFYQALWDHPHGTFYIHYAVDRKTGEVWGVDSCESLTSPSLKKLQKAIRNRIGLTVDEFRKVRRRGPYCNQ